MDRVHTLSDNLYIYNIMHISNAQKLFTKSLLLYFSVRLAESIKVKFVRA